MMKENRTYTCAVCNRKFIKKPADEACAKKYENYFNINPPPDGAEILCGDCYKKAFTALGWEDVKSTRKYGYED